MTREEKQVSALNVLKVLLAIVGSSIATAMMVVAFVFDAGAASADWRDVPPRMDRAETAIDSLRDRANARDGRERITLCYLRALAEVGGATRDGCLLLDQGVER